MRIGLFNEMSLFARLWFTGYPPAPGYGPAPGYPPPGPGYPQGPPVPPPGEYNSIFVDYVVDVDFNIIFSFFFKYSMS